MPTQTKNKPAKISLDFSNVEDRRSGKKSVYVPEGDYLLEMRDYEIKEKKDGGSKYISWQAYVLSPSSLKGKGPIYHISSLKKENLWSIRNLLEDMGIKVPKKLVDVPLGKCLNRSFGATIEDDEYTNDDGKTTKKSKIAATFPSSEYADVEGGGTETDEDDEDSDEEAATEAATSDDDEDLEELDIDDI
jgi:hypothetical protein